MRPHPVTLTRSPTLYKTQDLQAASRDPSSSFHIPSGQSGPSSPDAPPPTHDHAATPAPTHTVQMSTLAYRLPPGPAGRSDTPHTLEWAKQCLREWEYDPTSFWEQRILWGDHDVFQWVLSLLRLNEGVLMGENV